MVILIVVIALVIFACVWRALIASGRANERESEYQTFNRKDEDDDDE